MPVMTLRSKFDGTCRACGARYRIGDMIAWKPGSRANVIDPATGKRKRGGGSAYHLGCNPEAVEPVENFVPDAADNLDNAEIKGVIAPELQDKGGEPMGIEAALIKLVRDEAAKVPQTLDESAINRHVQTLFNSALASGHVKALVATEVAAEVAKAGGYAPRVIEIVQPDREPVKIEGAHYLMERLVRLMGAGFHVYLWGPAGSGKTTAAMQAAKALSREAEIDTLDPSTFRSMVQGYMTPTGEPVHTSFTRCWTEGKVYVADECDNAPGHVQTLFNSALANGHAPLAWSNVARRDGFEFIGTGNTPGAPTRAFPDRRPMSAAFKDRLYFMHWPIDPAIECRSAGLPCPAAPRRDVHKANAKTWVSFVRNLRTWSETNMPTLMITPRASLFGMQALALGETPEEVADALIFRGCDGEMREKALKAVQIERLED